MKKNGFTLIELLAVIVILAIIALIATPTVLNIIEDSEKSAAERSTEAVVKATEVYYMTTRANNAEYKTTVDFGSESTTKDLVKVDKAPTAGTVNIAVSTDGNSVTITATDLIFSGYKCGYTGGKASCVNNKK